MKKHNDGYVLPFVLVVLVVVCLVAVSLMSNSLSNLQRQQASIERMQAKYAAMGEIEREISEQTAMVNKTYKVLKSDGVANEDDAVKYVLGNIFGSSIDLIWKEDGTFTYSSTKGILASNNKAAASVIVSATVRKIEVIPQEDGENTYFQVPVTGSVTYTSYSHEGGDG